MKPGRGKNKGNSFEREVCAKLSLWITNGERKDCFWRSAISGGRSTRRRQQGEEVKVQLGDICAVDPLGHVLTDQFYIECKHYKDLRVGTFLLTNTGPLAQFWIRTKQEAEKYNRIPMLIAKQNMYPSFVLFTRSTLLLLPDVNLVIRGEFHNPQNCIFILLEDLLGLKFVFRRHGV